MTYQADVARGRDVVSRWCALAEQRLEHLTELFESGRWRRFHSEIDFLENIREAKAAVETWRGLAEREAARSNSAAYVSWPGRAAPPLPRTFSHHVRQPAPKTAVFPVELSTREDSSEAPVVLPAADTPALDGVSAMVLDIDAIERRYPLLRNAL